MAYRDARLECVTEEAVIVVFRGKSGIA